MLNEDYRDMLQILFDNEVRFLIVGAYRLGAYGYPRATGDFDIWIDSIQKVIHIRSASRVGYSDVGVNKKRTALLKKLYNKKVSEANQALNATPKNGAH